MDESKLSATSGSIYLKITTLRKEYEDDEDSLVIDGLGVAVQGAQKIAYRSRILTCLALLLPWKVAFCQRN